MLFNLETLRRRAFRPAVGRSVKRAYVETLLFILVTILQNVCLVDHRRGFMYGLNRGVKRTRGARPSAKQVYQERYGL